MSSWPVQCQITYCVNGRDPENPWPNTGSTVDPYGSQSESLLNHGTATDIVSVQQPHVQSVTFQNAGFAQAKYKFDRTTLVAKVQSFKGNWFINDIDG